MLRTLWVASVCLALCFGFGGTAARAEDQQAGSADRHYAGALTPVFSDMVTAAGKVVAGFNELTRPDFHQAEARFSRGLRLYRLARDRASSLRPPPDMASTARYLRAALHDYVRAVTLYQQGAARKTVTMVSKGLPSYSRANRETDMAVASMRSVLGGQ